MQLSIRPLRDDDAARCVTLARTAHWPSDEAKWRRFLTIGDGFAAVVGADELVGTVIVNGFGDGRLVMIAMMLVHPKCQRSGVGARLMGRALEHAGGAVVALYATDAGHGLYTKLGFVDAGSSWRMSGPASLGAEVAPDGLRRLRDGDMEGICALDQASQGASRRRLLDALLRVADRTCVIERRGSIVAYGRAAIQDGARYLGPVVAEDAGDAVALAHALAEGGSEPLRIDLAPGETALHAWARSIGLREEGSSRYMVRHGASLPGERALVHALAGRAFG